MRFNDEYFRMKAAKVFNSFNLEADAEYRKECIQKLYIAFKEVNRDTRHACAEACLSLVNDDVYKDKGTKSPYEAYVIAKNEASNACMNV